MPILRTENNDWAVHFEFDDKDYRYERLAMTEVPQAGCVFRMVERDSGQTVVAIHLFEDGSLLSHSEIRVSIRVNPLHHEVMVHPVGTMAPEPISALSRVMHDLRLPLTAVYEHVRLLALLLPPEQVSSEEILRGLNIILDNAKFALDMANSFLEMIVLKTGQDPVNLTSVAPCELFGKAIQRLQILAEQEGLTISLDCEQAMPSQVESDALKLDRIVSNLLGNAIKFTKSGQIAVKVGVCEDRPDCWQFAVQDTGKGIEAHILPHIFEAFHRGPGAPSAPGLGLGLAIVKQYVELLGGSIQVLSEVGKGSTFTVVLPTKAPVQIRSAK
jgi:signal transduction histidine kinase